MTTERQPSYICEWPGDCGGTGSRSCAGCGGDSCMCRACFGQGTVACADLGGCSMCFTDVLEAEGFFDD